MLLYRRVSSEQIPNEDVQVSYILMHTQITYKQVYMNFCTAMIPRLAVCHVQPRPLGGGVVQYMHHLKIIHFPISTMTHILMLYQIVLHHNFIIINSKYLLTSTVYQLVLCSAKVFMLSVLAPQLGFKLPLVQCGCCVFCPDFCLVCHGLEDDAMKNSTHTDTHAQGSANLAEHIPTK